ncbi:MAG: metallophosphoesterase [Erythrobacter sp.]
MFKQLRQIFQPRPKTSPPAVPAGERYYAIGDIHGRLDLFEALIAGIEADDAAAGQAQTTIILLGDLVDRGQDSAGVITRTRAWQDERKVRVLTGNHEEMFLQTFDDIEVLRHFLKHGGRETIMSYGLTTKQFNAMTLEELHSALPQIVSEEEREYIAGFEDMIIVGDYVFVHAGIDPIVALNEQKPRDLRWIRDRFLSHQGPLEKVVVHGHTIFPKVMDCGNRIGIDTGAFRSGVLTALVLEGQEKRVLQAIDEDGSIEIFNEDRAQ